MKVSKIIRYSSVLEDEDINESIEEMEKAGWEVVSFSTVAHESLVGEDPLVTILFQREV